jgi:hypothetical protein
VGTFAQEFSGKRGAHLYTEAQAVFEIVAGEDLADASGGRVFGAAYFGDVVVTDPVEILNDVTEHNQREVDVLDSKTGPISKYALFATPNQSAVLAWTALDAMELWGLRVWLHTRKGRWKQFWASSWAADLVITRDVGSSDTTIEISAVGFSSEYVTPADFAIQTVDGSVYPFRATGASIEGGGRELLAIAFPIGTAIAASSIAKVSKLTLSRFNSDRIEIQHLPGRQATISGVIAEVPIYP